MTSIVGSASLTSSLHPEGRPFYCDSLRLQVPYFQLHLAAHWQMSPPQLLELLKTDEEPTGPEGVTKDVLDLLWVSVGPLALLRLRLLRQVVPRGHRACSEPQAENAFWLWTARA